MRKAISRAVTLGVLAVGLGAGAALAADVSIGVNIALPPPPAIVLPAPPALVLVPGTRVYQVPSVNDHNLFVFRGQYYSFHHGHWFLAKSHKGPWAMVAQDAVPAPILGVPVAYYKVPPGHAKKAAKHAAGAGVDCPPGQAKKGRC